INIVREGVFRQTRFAEEIKGGNLEASYEPIYEHDSLGHALLQIKENLIHIKLADEQRNWASTGLAKFVEILQSAKSLKELCNDLIVNLVRTIHANQGAIFILITENEQEILEMQSCYAFNRTKHLAQKIAPGEGLVGQAFLEKETMNLREVPDRFVRITSGLGEANPRHILIVPLKMNETIVGMVELASFKEFQKHEINFVEKIGESIAYTVSSIRTAESTQKMVNDLHEQAEQMKAQEEELRQNQEELQATQETISRKYDALFKKIGALNHQSRFDQLKSINSTKKRNIEYYFDIIRNQIQTFAEDRMVVDAVNSFRAAFYNMGDNTSAAQLPVIRNSVENYYTSEFIPRLNDVSSTTSYHDQFVPEDPRALLLQYLFISNNPNPTGKKSMLDDAGDGTSYSRVHSLYHPIVRNYLERFGYYDIFLIDAEKGDMLYSVFKEVDFATNLLHGQYSKTNFGRVVKNAIDSSDRNFVQLIDFEPYDPSYHAPASFIASPVYDGDHKIGIVVFQMPINKINQILTGNNNWREDGLGESGETFIVGKDHKHRSISRGLIENADLHLRSLKKQGYTEIALQQIKKMETNILLETVKQESVDRAFQGSAGILIEPNSAGDELLCAYAPLNISDVRWMIMSTMKEAEASERINTLKEGEIENQ
ncbi:MAG TPA: GAF domain-containing protein, partial [Chryseolinea sp.]